MTVAIGSQAGGGASALSFSDFVDYSVYYNALVGNSSGNATDTAAITSLGGASVNNPVTGSTRVSIRPTLAVALGIGSQISDSFSECGGLTANACILIGTAVF